MTRAVFFALLQGAYQAMPPPAEVTKQAWAFTYKMIVQMAGKLKAQKLVTCTLAVVSGVCTPKTRVGTRQGITKPSP